MWEEEYLDYVYEYDGDYYEEGDLFDPWEYDYDYIEFCERTESDPLLFSVTCEHCGWEFEVYSDLDGYLIECPFCLGEFRFYLSDVDEYDIVEDLEMLY